MSLYVSPHAAERFVERVRPDLDVAAARVELGRLLAEFGFECPRPEWCDPPQSALDGFYMEISDGIVALCLPPDRPHFSPAVMTVMVRAGSPRRVNARRRAKRRARAERRRPRVSGDFER